MSLESEIKNLTAAMTRLAEGVEKLLSISQPSTAAAPTPRKTNTNVDDAKIEQLAAEVLESVKAAGETDTYDSVYAERGSPEPRTFDDAKRAFLAIAQKFGAEKGTAKSKDVLARYGVPNLKALKSELYGEFIELCDHVVAGGEA